MIRVFTAFSGYDSQCLALNRLGIKYELVGWSEIDKFAIKAHDALFPQWADRNYGDISKVDWAQVPDFDLFTYSSPCFVAGTLVLTDRGYVPIEDVKVGDMVLTHKNRYQKVLRVGHKQSSDLYEIKGMAFDKIVCTGNHPFYVRKTLDNQAEWVQASRITTDNYVCVLRKNKCNVFRWVRPKSIEPIEGETAIVYNLEVENDNSYTANGVVVHNCQDFSQAGLQRGGIKGSGTRSSLLWECERAIIAKRPKYLLMENVAALVSNKFIKTFQQWMALLEGYGYRNTAQVLNAKDYGVPQNRERIFLVSVREDCEPNPYYFPKPQKLTRVLKDVLEKNVDEKYYLSDTMLEYFNRVDADKTHGHNFTPKKGNDTAFTIRTTPSSRVDDNFIKDETTETENSEQC